MSDECDLCLLGLIFFSSLLTGSSEVKETHVFFSSGENVPLSCNITLHDCNSTTWIYNRFSHSSAVEVIGLGIKMKDTERHERLSLGSDCSLNIKNITEEDRGRYICQQWTGVKGQHQKQRPDVHVYLHVLHVSSSSSSSSSSQAEISADSVTLSCQLYSFAYAGDSCDDWIRLERIDLFWVNQAGVKLKRSDSRYQILLSSDHCLISLNTTLLNEDLNREWRCEVTHRDQVKSSATFTVKSSAQDDPVSPAIPVNITKSTITTPVTPTRVEVIVIVIIVGTSFVLLIPALILWLVWKKRAGIRRAIDESVEQTDVVTYTEVTAFSKHRAKRNKVHYDDKVTYASVRQAEAEDQDNCSQIYASINKNKSEK